MNVYDIREPCGTPPLCYDFSAADSFLTDPTMMENLGVRKGQKWEECNMEVHSALMGDWMANLEVSSPSDPLARGHFWSVENVPKSMVHKMVDSHLIHT
jgi:hypothetical protein